MPSKGLTGSQWHVLVYWCCERRDELRLLKPEERHWHYRDARGEFYATPGFRPPTLPKITINELEEACRLAGVGKEESDAK